jgi:hypothetical protein
MVDPIQGKKASASLKSGWHVPAVFGNMNHPAIRQERIIDPGNVRTYDKTLSPFFDGQHRKE